MGVSPFAVNLSTSIDFEPLTITLVIIAIAVQTEPSLIIVFLWSPLVNNFIFNYSFRVLGFILTGIFDWKYSQYLIEYTLSQLSR